MCQEPTYWSITDAGKNHIVTSTMHWLIGPIWYYIALLDVLTSEVLDPKARELNSA